MVKDEWIVHPNRSELGPDAPGRNGHFRSSRPALRTVSAPKCAAHVHLSHEHAHLGDADGTVTFGGDDWWWVVGVAFMFAQKRLDSAMPPFGYTRDGLWWWWDDTTTTESLLDSPDGQTYVQDYLAHLFPDMAVELTDRRQ